MATSAKLSAGAPLCGTRHAEFRIAMLTPLLGPSPSYLPYFIASAARSAQLVDWLIFHEKAAVPWDRPPNVKFVDLGGGGLAELVGLKLGERLDLPLRNATILLRSFRLLFERWPRLVAEYKPTFATVFEDFLSGYTHWGYCDLDMVIGNLPLFIEREELELYDIVSYGFGDAEALYLRGQWTVHRNKKSINEAWKQCGHLGTGLQIELDAKVDYLKRMDAAGKKNFPTRFLSAEGCYSYEVLRSGMHFKIANKQAIGSDIRSNDTVLVVGGAVWACGAVEVGESLLAELAARTALEPCRVTLPPLHRKVGGDRKLEVSGDDCGKWISPEFRMCLETGNQIGKQANLELAARGGAVYAQDLDDPGLQLANGCRQVAFFHFQEWKKLWELDGASSNSLSSSAKVAPLRASDTTSAPAFQVTTRGISLLS